MQWGAGDDGRAAAIVSVVFPITFPTALLRVTLGADQRIAGERGPRLQQSDDIGDEYLHQRDAGRRRATGHYVFYFAIGY